MFEDKYIREMKLVVTNECRLECSFCLRGSCTEGNMGFETAEKAVDILMNSVGSNKTLVFTGGEPFLNKEVVKRTVRYARKVEKEVGKELEIVLGTGLVDYDESFVKFLEEENVFLSISLADRRTHDSERVFPSGDGSYELVRENFQKVERLMSDDRYLVALCVLPSNVDRLYSMYRNSVETGFRNFRIALIKNYEKWDDASIAVFREQYRKIVEDIIRKYEEGMKIHNIAVNRSYKSSERFECPLVRSIYVSTDGDIYLSPFDMDNGKGRTLGNIGEEITIKNCQNKFENCSKCVEKLSPGEEMGEGDRKVFEVYKDISEDFAELLEKRKEYFKDYIDDMIL